MKFIIYSVFGYFIECIYTSAIEKKFNYKRGLLMGPYCPIYGLTLSATNKIIESNLCYIWKVIIICLVVFFIEYGTSLLLEKIFHRKWWDYSKKKYNLNGRVCLENIVIFIIGALFIGVKINPLFNFIFNIDDGIFIVIVFLLFIIFMIDCFFSIKKYYHTRYYQIKLNRINA